VLQKFIEESVECRPVLAVSVIVLGASDCLDRVAMRRNPPIQGEFAVQLQERRELGAKPRQQIFETRPFLSGYPLLGRMRERRVRFVARRGDQGGRFASDALGKASSAAG